MKVTLTARNVKTLPAINGKRTDYPDKTLEGFVLRVTPTGARTYGIRYGAKGTRVTIGKVRRMTLKAARTRAEVELGRVAGGADPAGERRAVRRARRLGTSTLLELALGLVREAELGDRTRYVWRRLLEAHVLKTLGCRDPATITPDDVRDLVAKIAKRTPQQANDVLKVLSWVYGRALADGLLKLDKGSPCAGLRKPKKVVPRSRVLRREELRALWGATEAAGPYGQAVRLALLTGCRRGEVFGARWDEVEEGEKLWRIEGARTKNAAPHDVPLTRTALDLLKMARAEADDSPFVFPGVDPKKPRLPTSKEWTRLLKAAGIVVEEDKADEGTEKSRDQVRAADEGHEGPAPKTKKRKAWTALPIRFHDLRRTLRNTLTRDLNVGIATAEAVVGHVQNQLMRTYAPDGVPLSQVRGAVEKWERELLRIVAEKPAKKVTNIAEARS